MFLTAFLDSSGRIFTHPDFLWGSLGTNPYLKVEATVTTGRENVSSARNWVNFFSIVGFTFNQMRNELIGLLAGWATLTDDNKKAMVENYVYPVTETITNLNLLYTQAERDALKKDTMKMLNAEPDNLFSILQDSIDGNYYKTVTSAGSILTTVIKTDEVL